MSLATQSARVEYTAEADQTTFPYPFRIFEATDLAIYQNTSLLAPSAYAVTGVGEDAGGSVVLVVEAEEGDEVIIESEIPATQDVTYTPGGAFPAASHERGLDRLTRLVQQLRHRVSRCLQVNTARSFGLTDLELPVPDGAPTQADGRWTPVWNAARTNLELAEFTTETGLLASAVDSSTLAGLPAPGTAGRLRRLTDSVRGVWMDTGTTWRPIEAGANVRDFAAVGSGLVDDTAAFQAADTAAVASDVSVIIPAGTYLVSSMAPTRPHIFRPGAVLRVAAGQVVTFTGIDGRIIADRDYIFDADGVTTGTVTWTSARANDQLEARWWIADTADAAVGVQAAVNAASFSTTALVRLHFAGGNYTINTPIIVPALNASTMALMHFVGEASGQRWSVSTGGTTLLTFTGTSGACLDFRLGTDDTTRNFQGVIENLQLNGTDDADTYGIKLQQCKQAKFLNLAVNNFGTGIHQNGASYYSTWRDVVSLSNLSHGVFLTGESNGATLTDCRFSNNGGNGMRLVGQNIGPRLYGTYFEQNADFGLYLSNVRSCAATSCYFEGNSNGAISTNGFTSQAGAQGALTVTDAHFGGGGGVPAIEIRQAHHYLMVVNCTVSGHSALVGRNPDSTPRSTLLAIANRHAQTDYTTAALLVTSLDAFHTVATWCDELAQIQFGAPNYVGGQGVAANANTPTAITKMQRGASGAGAVALLEMDSETAPGSAWQFLAATADAGTTPVFRLTGGGALGIRDGMTAPTAVSGLAFLYVDSADGDLKCRFADGVTKVLATDT